MKAINYLNEFGDITIAWEEEGDEGMLDVISKQMGKGMTFWAIEPRMKGFLPPKKTKLKSVDDIKDERVLSMKDEDFFKLVADGIAGVIEPKKERSLNPLNFIKRLKSPKEVIANETKSSVAMKPLRGG